MPARRPHVPSQDKRKLISVLAAIGCDRRTMAEMAGLTPKELRDHYSDEIALGKNTIDAMVGHGVIERALSGDNPASFFYLKHKAGWTDTVKHAGHDGGPLKLDVRSLSRDQILELLAAGRAAGLDGHSPGRVGEEGQD